MNNEEMNAKVAELRDGDLPKEIVICANCPAEIDRCDSCDGMTVVYNDPKPYSTDMNCAMELVEEWEDKTGWFGASKEDGRYIVSYSQCMIGGEDEDLGFPEATTLPRAICKAYIEWKEQQSAD